MCKIQIPNAKCCVTNGETERQRNRETDIKPMAQTGLIGSVLKFLSFRSGGGTLKNSADDMVRSSQAFTVEI